MRIWDNLFLKNGVGMPSATTTELSPAQRTATLREALAVALDSLRSHKLRSFLTLLGIIVATTTLIGVIAIIEGMNRYIAERFANLGTNVFLIVRIGIISDFTPKKFLEILRRNPLLKPEEYEYLRGHMTLAAEVGLQANTTHDVRYGNESLEDVQVAGVTPNMIYIDVLEVDYGRYISESDNQHRTSVAFLGRDVVNRFFPNADPLGKTIQVDGRPFQVAGVAKPLGTVFGFSRDNFVFIPIETLFKMYGSRRNMAFNIRARGTEYMRAAEDEARLLLRAYRHVRPNEPDNFGLIASDEIMELWKRITGAIAATAVAVTSVFMVVGGIVIMNIMLASVTERTHEIGIRKSVGARRRDILLQFLVESALLAACGGILGVLAAWGVTSAVRAFTPMPTAIPASAVVMAVVLSAAVGLFFGIYPARKAARLDPIEALRVET